MRRAITTATTSFTSPGKASRAIPISSRATSRSSCTACPTAPATCKNSRTWWQGSKRKSSCPKGSITASNPVYTPEEMMATVAARELRDGEVVFVGIGLPNLACNLARATHAPNLVLIYESGAVGASPSRLPVSIGDPALVTGSLMVCGMADVFQLFLQNGRIEVGFLGGAQVDRYGNINTTVIGSYERPAVRLPGSGGAAEIAVHARRTLIVAKLNPRAFPEQVDFVTSPGQGRGGRGRRQLGMPRAGSVKGITNKSNHPAAPATREGGLAAHYPGVPGGPPPNRPARAVHR